MDAHQIGSAKNPPIVPLQVIGSKTGATAKLKQSSRHDALLLFQAARKRLMDINNWRKWCGNTGAEFQLTNKQGQEKKSLPEIGDLIRIKLPALPNREGDGFDWVRIEAFEESKTLLEDVEIFGFRVRPVKNPANYTGDSAHFYTSDATSTFLIIRYSHTVYALERGRNEVPNSSGTWLNRFRNILIAVAAMLGFSKSQWQQLLNGLLNPPQLND
jgi:hypothetical protein